MSQPVKPRGQQPHKPTQELRERVCELRSHGIKQRTIAKIIGIDEDTLVKYYKEELDEGGESAVAKVASTLFKKSVDGDVTSMIFYLKTRGRWRTSDTDSTIESNERLRQEMIELRKELDAKNKKEY